MTAAEQVVDAVVIEPEQPSQELVHQPRRGEVLRPLDVAQQKEAMQTYQRGLREILDDSDWQQAGWDRQKQQPRKFVKKSGWRKIAAWFDLSIELLRDEVERDEDGNVARACVWARAVAPSGRFADGDGYCEITEERFSKDKGREKLENGLRGTATTRAVNRAISNLVGMGDVSAEEMPDEPPAADTTHPQGPPADEELRERIGPALMSILGGDHDRAKDAYKKVTVDLGVSYMPQAAAQALVTVAGSLDDPPWMSTLPDPE